MMIHTPINAGFAHTQFSTSRCKVDGCGELSGDARKEEGTGLGAYGDVRFRIYMVSWRRSGLFRSRRHVHASPTI